MEGLTGMNHHHYDVIIAGSGVAGLYTALNLDPRLRVLVLCKREMLLTNTALAQGGVAAVLNTQGDSYDLHYTDTMIAGGYANRPEAVRVLVEEGPGDVRRIYQMGVRFDTDEDGQLQSTLEGGHSRRRIVHHRDSTGREIAERLIEQTLRRDNIVVMEHATLFRLVQVTGGFFAHVLLEGRVHSFSAPYVVLATGGIGRVYKYTTNSAIATGDGIRLAYELGCKIAHLDYIQFHPTAFAAKEKERFLISEAVRGEGAYLLNAYKERFMQRYDSRLELAPRDVVSKSIILESRRCGSEEFYLDITHRDADYLKDRFPMIYERCLEQGVDITKDLIPVFPCQHYLMGGIDVDLYARTGVDRLYAVGECSHTGVHGKNRLASNSLLEALVFGRRAAQDIMDRRQHDRPFAPISTPSLPNISGAPMPAGLADQVREIMQRAYFVLPDDGAVREGLRRITAIRERLLEGGFATTPEYCDTLSIATAASIILREMDK